MTRPATKLSQLTSLRFFAALCVLLSHLSILQTSENVLHGVATTVFREGYCGVTFFYVLSGFILSHTYEDGLLSGRITSARYLMLRVVRIFPLHLAIAVPLALAALWRLHDQAIGTVLLNLALLQSWVPSSSVYFSLNSVSWSLSDEVFFYATFLVLVRLGTRTLAGLAAAWLVAALAWALTLVLTVPSGPDVGHWSLYVSPLTRLLDFMVGMLVYRLSRPHLANASTASASAWTALECCCVAVLVAAMYAYPAFGVRQELRYELAYLPIMAALVFAFAQGRGLVSAWLAHPTLVFLGEASFALYMIHHQVVARVIALHDARGWHLPPVLFAFLLAAACIALSAFVYRYAEDPVHRALRRRVSSSSRAATAAAPAE
jgi:peptidoglycan/LPS O-acetylase OafA/YrhL